jgi:hypothetical protein
MRRSMSLPISVAWGAEAGGRRSYILGRTKDVSPKGICFWIPRRFSAGQRLNLVMKLPQETQPLLMLQLQCDAEVVRVEQEDSRHERFCVATRVFEFDTPMIVPADPVWPA